MRWALVAALIVAAYGGAAAARTPEELIRRCHAPAVNDQTIDSCSAVIVEGQVPLKAIAIAHHNRGLAWQMRGDFDRAIADYDEALRLRPTYVSALIYRDSAYFEKLDVDRALSDFQELLRIEPPNPIALFGRGVDRRKLGDVECANPDIAVVKAMRPDIAEQFSRYWVKDL